MAEVTDRRKRAVHASALRIIYVSMPFETALCWSRWRTSQEVTPSASVTAARPSRAPSLGQLDDEYPDIALKIRID
jgi:hypothetical protein